MTLSTVKDIARAYGPLAAIHDVAKRAINRVTPVQVLTTLRVTMATVDRCFLQPVPGFDAGFASDDELFAWAEEPGYDLDADFVRAALTKGDRCFALRENGVLAAYGWYSRHPTLIAPRLELHFSPHYAYMYKGFTAKEFRGRRLHAYGMAGALACYVQHGALGLVSYVDSTNFASLQSCHRMGYEETGYIVIMEVAGHLFTRSTATDPETRMNIEVLP